LNVEEHYIQSDSIRIHQVFWNLINNAVKFTPPGGKIDIRTCNDDRGRFRLSIFTAARSKCRAGAEVLEHFQSDP
jgi:signal transduction histidine kinase